MECGSSSTPTTRLATHIDAFEKLTMDLRNDSAQSHGQEASSSEVKEIAQDTKLCNTTQQAGSELDKGVGMSSNTDSAALLDETAQNAVETDVKVGKKKRKNHRAGRKHKRKSEKSTNADAQHHEDEVVGDKMKDQTIHNLPKVYDIKAAAGKGLGAFAVQEIKRGTRIMRERPLMQASFENVIEIPRLFSNLSEEDKAVFLSLHCRSSGDVDAKRRAFLFEHLESQEEALGLSMEEQVQVMGIFETNAFKADSGSVICPEASRINHSCVPNVHHCWNNTIGAETVHAVRDISIGEEITTTYIAICRTHDQRESELDRYGFKCSCPACDTSTAFGMASKRRRERLFKLDQDLAMYDQLPMFSQIRDDHQALRGGQEVMKLLAEEGLTNMEVTRSYREAASFHAKLGDFKTACSWTEKAMENTAMCAGRDYEGFRDDEKTLQDLVAKREANLRQGHRLCC